MLATFNHSSTTMTSLRASEVIDIDSGPEDEPILRPPLPTLPTHFQARLPHRNLSITGLLEYPFPTQASDPLIQLSTSSYFSNNEPTEDPNTSLSRPLPPSESTVIENLQQKLPEAIRHGAKSLVDPHYVMSRLPLYTIQYWTQLDFAKRRAAKWRRANAWRLEHGAKVEDDKLQDDVKSVMDTITWEADLRIMGVGSPVDELAELLSDDWLNDDMMNAAMDYIARRARDTAAAVIVAPLWLYFRMRTANEINAYSPEKPGPSILRHYWNLITIGKKTHLYFPVHDNNHWTVFEVNFAKKTLRHGESCTKAINKLLTGL